MTKKLLLGLSFGFVGTLLILLIFAPLIVRKTVVNRSKEWIGRSISLDRLKVNYFTGTAKLINFKLYEPDDTSVFIGFDTLIIDTEPYRYFNNALVIEQLYLKGFQTHVVMYDSSFNFDDLLDFHQSGASGSDTTSASESLAFELSNFELSDAFFTLCDASIDQQMELNNIDFFVPYIAWDEAHTSEAGLKFNFKNGGFFQSNIDVAPLGGDFEAEIILENFDLSGYKDFVSKYADTGDFEGKADLDIVLRGNINAPDSVKGSGILVINDFKLRDHASEDLLSLDRFTVRLQEADAANGRFLIDSVLLLKPWVHFKMHDSTNNITDYLDRFIASIPAMEEDTVDEKTDSESSADELYYALAHLTIQDGMVDILDGRTAELFKYHLSDIELTTDSITSKSNWVATQSNMLLNNRGKLVANVGLNPADPINQLKVEYTITDFMLSDLNIYSRHYMGFPILYGDMYYKARTEITDGQISSDNKLIIHNVELGEKGRGIYDLPLKFALFLLKDKDGVITLDVPVSGDLKDPKVSVGKIVWNTLKNLIIKTAAAPARLLSGLLGADPKEIEVIEYDFMDTVFSQSKQRQLDLLLELEQQKPELEIELIYYNDPSLEKREIAIQLVGIDYEKENNSDDYKSDKEAFEQFVWQRLGTDTLDLNQGCLAMADPQALDSIAAIFQQKRIADISNYMLSVRDSTEILVIPSKPDAPKNPGSKPIFEVKYGMKEEHFK